MERNPNDPPKLPGLAPFAGAGGTSMSASPAFDLALSRIGFNGARNPDAKPVLPAAFAARAPRADAAAATVARDLARRDWILGVMERQRGLSQLAGGLVRCEGMESRQFLDHFYAPARPCVMTGAIDHWPALARWTPDYLRETVGDAPVEFQGDRGKTLDFEVDKARLKRVMPFGAFLDMILANPGNDAYVTANNSDNAGNRAAFAPLMADTGSIPACLRPGDGMIWIGPAGTFTPLHFDLTNNLLVQVVGRKRLLLVPPSGTGNLYNSRHVFSDVHDLEDEARLRQYPRARAVTPFEVTLGPGEILFIPIGWWHQVRSLEFSVMLTYTSFLWPNEGFQDYPRDAEAGR